MKLSDGEKLILVMLSEIYKKLDIQGEIDHKLVLTSIFNNKAWGLKWEYGGLFNSPEDNSPVVQETCDILDMYRWIRAGYARLSDAEKARVKKETTHWAEFVEFKGFDANNDEHFRSCKLLGK